MSAVIKNANGKTWGTVAESFGLSVKSFRQKADSDRFDHKDESGEVATKVFYNQKSAFTISGATTAAPDTDIADSLTLANELASLGGVTGGTNLVHSVEVTRENEALREITIEGERHPTLTVA